jgi:hypothetical protein
MRASEVNPPTRARPQTNGKASVSHARSPQRSGQEEANLRGGNGKKAADIPEPTPEPGVLPPGLDDTRHEAAQRAAAQAEFLRTGMIPALMATATSLDKFVETAAYKVYLEDVVRESGNATDPIERMLIEQLAIAHFRIADLQAKAGKAEGVESTKLLNTVASRMLGEFRRTALALQVYRSHLPKGKRAENLKILKMAQ